MALNRVYFGIKMKIYPFDTLVLENEKNLFYLFSISTLQLSLNKVKAMLSLTDKG